MPLLTFACTDFRCLGAVEFRPHPQFSLVYGANASGKTSLLEGIGYLGRGRSFRNASTRELVRHGADSFLLRGIVGVDGLERRLGVRNGKDGLELSVDGDRSGGIASLTSVMPLQVIDPDVHELVGGAPDQRRRFLDWMTFHVEHGYLESWRRFRRALKQRNSVLKAGGSSLDSWDREYVETALQLDAARTRVMAVALPVLESAARRLLGVEVNLEYQRGWARDTGLAEQVRLARHRDRSSGSSSAGPHRADLRLRVDERVARRLVSRGQQKLLACALVLGSVSVVGSAIKQVPLLLLDDPAAELDEDSLDRLMAAVGALGGQVVATALTPHSVPLPASHTLFHVEQGVLTSGTTGQIG